MNNVMEILDIDLPNPRGPAPLRRPLSVRRTSSIDVTWPDGVERNAHFHCCARDIFTPANGGDPEEITCDEMFAEIAPDRTIKSIRSVPPRENIGALVGVRGGGHLRSALNEALPDDRAKGSPLYLLIDDLSGASLVSGWALYSSGKVNLPNLDREEIQEMMEQRQGICIGFRPGSSALDPEEGIGNRQNSSRVQPLHHPEDPEGWHPLHYGSDLSFRRARRIDVWIDGDIRIDATFQDSAAKPDGGREAIHEYSLHVTADPETLAIKSIEATPHVLPFPECPNAIENIHRMVGEPLGEMRTAVLENFPRVKGCTHLNDCMRSIAEVPAMVRELRDRI